MGKGCTQRGHASCVTYTHVLEALGGVAGARGVKEWGDGPGAWEPGRSFP